MRWEQDALMQNVEYSNDRTEIYAEYHVPSGVSVTNANQNLTFSVKVDCYKKDVTSDMAPEFEVWMEGNKPDDVTSDALSLEEKDTHNTIISGQVNLDTSVIRHVERNFRGLKDNVSGQYMNFGIGVSITQPFASFSDLRGVEFPRGKVEIDVEGQYDYRLRNEGYSWHKVNDGQVQLVEYGLNQETKSGYYLAVHLYITGLPFSRYGLYSENKY